MTADVRFAMAAAVSCMLTLSSCSMTRSPSSVALDHAALHVRDLEKSARFYEQLGLERIDDPFKNGSLIWLSAGPHRQLHLIAGREETAAPDMPVHLAFTVRSIAAAAARLDGAKIPYYSSSKELRKVTTRPDGVRQIYLQDPDGYWIELNDAANKGRR